MINDISNYFNDQAALDNLSVTEIEQLINEVPTSSVYKMLLAKKMSSIRGHNILLCNNDRLMMHFLMNDSGEIPSISDLQNNDLQSSEIFKTPNMHISKDISSIVPIEIPIIESNAIQEEIIVTHENVAEVKASEQNAETETLSSEQQNFDEILDTHYHGNSIKIKKKKDKNKFKLKEYSGISEFSKWLLSFKKEGIEDKIIKEERAAKKRALEESAKKSVTKSPSIISEHLAEILANQGHLDDAKKMYEQLMQKYPEKSSYFAAKINLLIKI